jgi:hypothetical protein
MKRHGSIHDPGDDDQERSHKEGNLNAGSNRYAHSQVHLVANSHHHGGDVLCSITDDWNQNQTDEGPADTGALHNSVDASNKVIGAHGNQERNNHENNACRKGPHARLLMCLLFASLLLGVEEITVSPKLENQVHDVEKK